MSKKPLSRRPSAASVRSPSPAFHGGEYLYFSSCRLTDWIAVTDEIAVLLLMKPHVTACNGRVTDVKPFRNT